MVAQLFSEKVMRKTRGGWRGPFSQITGVLYSLCLFYYLRPSKAVNSRSLDLPVTSKSHGELENLAIAKQFR